VPRAVVCLPTYNERENLEPMVAALGEALDTTRDLVLVVDDSSPDGTGRLADGLAAEHDWVVVLHRERKEGLGRAYRAAFERALELGAELVLEIDCDFSHDPSVVPRLIEACESGADLALGSRYVPGGGVAGWHPARRAISRAGCLYARTVLRVPVRDLTGGLKTWRAGALRAIEPATVRSQGYAFQVELTHRALRRGLRVVETPIVFRERPAGRSKMTLRIALEAAWLVPALRSSSGPDLPTPNI
jgi:dolichol-phosphate mannosyltransferase